MDEKIKEIKEKFKDVNDDVFYNISGESIRHIFSHIQSLESQLKQLQFDYDQCYKDKESYAYKLESQLNEEDGIILKKPYNADPMPHQGRTPQLKVKWDEERVREIEKWLKEEMPFPVTAEEHWKACKYVIYLLSLLKRERVEKKELEKILGEGSMEIRLLQARERIKELEERITELEANELRFPTLAEFSNLQDDHEKAEARIKELEEGIEKHREITLGYDSGIPEADEELYKLVEKK